MNGMVSFLCIAAMLFCAASAAPYYPYYAGLPLKYAAGYRNWLGAGVAPTYTAPVAPAAAAALATLPYDYAYPSAYGFPAAYGYQYSYGGYPFSAGYAAGYPFYKK